MKQHIHFNIDNYKCFPNSKSANPRIISEASRDREDWSTDAE